MIGKFFGLVGGWLVCLGFLFGLFCGWLGWVGCFLLNSKRKVCAVTHGGHPPKVQNDKPNT